jgi:hypothetical protein
MFEKNDTQHTLALPGHHFLWRPGRMNLYFARSLEHTPNEGRNYFASKGDF